MTASFRTPLEIHSLRRNTSARREPPAPVIRIVIADDHPMVREGLHALLATQPDFMVVAEARNGEEALEFVRELQPDLLLLDLSMPGRSGIDVLRALHEEGTSACRTILITAVVDRVDLPTVMRLGARGIVLKDSPMELVFKCLRKVHAGEVWVSRETMSDLMEGLTQGEASQSASIERKLTDRERQVVQLIAEGDTNKSIAARLGVSEGTVKHHLTSIFTKTGVANRLELGLLAIQKRLPSKSGVRRPG